MDVRRRNRIVSAVHALVPSIMLFLLVWALLQAGGRKWWMRSGPAAVAAAVVAAAFFLWFWAGGWWASRGIDSAMREAGIDPDVVPEQPLPLIPRLRLAKNTDELVAGILFLVLLVFVFVAYYAGWIGRWTGHPYPPK